MRTPTPAVVEHASQDMNRWLRALVEEHHFRDRAQAYTALRAGLHALRDRLTPEQAVHLGAQLPTLVRGVYYEGWRLAGKPLGIHSVQEYCDRLGTELPDGFGRDALSVAKTTLALLWKELDPGETAKLIDGLPVPLRSLWPAEAAR